MALRSSSRLLVAGLCLVAVWCLAGLVAPAFVSAPARAASAEPARFDAAQAAVLSTVLAVPQVAHAGTSGYAILQLGWAVFIIGLGPAVLFYIYFNKPEIL